MVKKVKEIFLILTSGNYRSAIQDLEFSGELSPRLADYLAKLVTATIKGTDPPIVSPNTKKAVNKYFPRGLQLDGRHYDFCFRPAQKGEGRKGGFFELIPQAQ